MDLTSPPAEHFDPLALQISKVSEALALVVQEQAYLRAREERHRISRRANHAFRPIQSAIHLQSNPHSVPSQFIIQQSAFPHQLRPELAAIVCLVA